MDLGKPFDDAVKNGAVVFTPSTSEIINAQGIQLYISVATSLASKQTHFNTSAHRSDPFQSPESDLVVEKEFMNQYSVLLNKYAILPRHCLLITREFEPQSAPLRPHDLNAAYCLLRDLNAAGKRHLGFFNSGNNSGASQPHRHLQFVEYPNNFEVHMDAMFRENAFQADKLTKPLIDTRVPWAHFGVITSHIKNDEDELGMAYSKLLASVITVFRNESISAQDVAYNLLFTEDWMMAVPRKAEMSHGMSLNGLGVAGILLAKSEEELALLRDKNLDIIADACFPAISPDKEEQHHDY